MPVGKDPFNIQLLDDRVTLSLDSNLNAEKLETLEEDLQQKLFRPVFVELGALSPALYQPAGRSLAKVARLMRKVERDVVLLGATPDFMNVLKTQGTFGIFYFSKSANDASEAMKKRDLEAEATGHNPSATNRINVGIINPFLLSAIQVFQAQAKVTAKSGTPMKREAAEPLSGDYSGLILFEGASFTGAICISFPAPTLTGIICATIGETRPLSPSEISGGAGELLSIIVTQAKALLSKEGKTVSASLPQLINDKKLPANSKYRQRVAIPFESDVGPFNIEILAT